MELIENLGAEDIFKSTKMDSSEKFDGNLSELFGVNIIEPVEK